MRRLYRVAFRVLQLGTIITRRRGSGVKCVITHGPDVLLVRHSYGPRRVWQLPGGSMRRGESPGETAAREMREELGLTGLDWRELLAVEVRLERMPVRLTCLHAELADPSAVRVDPVEIEEARWFPVDDLPPRRSSEIAWVVQRAVAE